MVDYLKFMKDQLSEAFQLRKSHNFQQAVDIYQPLWQQDQKLFDDWHGWSYAFSLSRLNRHAEALEICRTLYPRYPQSEILNSLYSKSIYYTQFAGKETPPLAVIRKAVEGMLRLSPPHSAYSFTPRAIFKLVKALFAQQNCDWQEVEAWLSKMDPDLLDDRPFKMVRPDGKETELASPKEEWYSYMIRAKGGLEQPHELLNMIETARKQGIRWHYNNDIWFDRKKAFALNQLGRRKEAEEILRKILQKKTDWFLIVDLASVVESNDERLQLLSTAALAPADPVMKINLYHTIFNLLKDADEHKTEATLHLCLIAAIREENQWPALQPILDQIAARGTDINRQGSSALIIKNLTPFWKKFATDNYEKKYRGRVTKIFPGDRSGIITSDRRRTYFTAFDGLKDTPRLGMDVSFRVEDSFDKKKNKPSKIAVKLKEIKK